MRTQAPVQRGFTLIELLVVMGILGLLVMLLMPAVNYAIQVGFRVATAQTIGRIEGGIAGFYSDWNCYPPSDNVHELTTYAKANGYKNIAIFLRGPQGTGWGAGNSDGNKVPSGGTDSTTTYGPYFEGGATEQIDDAYKPAMPILYFRYEATADPESITSAPSAPFDINDNLDATAVKGFTDQGNLNMLVRRRGSYQYARTDYVLISAGPDRKFGWWADPEGDGTYAAVVPANKARPAETEFTTGGAYCDDVTNIRYE